MESYATLTTRLSEARAARHTLAIGGQVAEVWRDGKRLTYTPANLPDLERYIAQLELDIANHPDNPSLATTQRRPVRARIW